MAYTGQLFLRIRVRIPFGHRTERNKADPPLPLTLKQESQSTNPVPRHHLTPISELIAKHIVHVPSCKAGDKGQDTLQERQADLCPCVPA